MQFCNEQMAAERDQKLINDRGKYGNTSCGTNYWTAGSPAFWTAQTNLNERENCEQQNGTLVSYELDTSTLSSSTKNDSLEEKGYSSKGITQIEKIRSIVNHIIYYPNMYKPYNVDTQPPLEGRGLINWRKPLIRHRGQISQVVAP